MYCLRTGERIGKRIVPGSPVIPIFVLFSDKPTALGELIRSCHEILRTSFEIIVIDFGSTTRRARDLLDMLSINSVNVHNLSAIKTANDLHTAATIIEQYMRIHKNITHYVVTDSDISLHGSVGNVLEVYQHIHTQVNNNTGVVGPALNIAGLPADIAYDAGQDAGHTAVGWEHRFWPKMLDSVIWKQQRIYYMRAPIDTTFGMFARSTKWGRLLNPSVRVAHPYAMRHIDFEYSLSLGVPPDMIEYSCRKAKSGLTHFLVTNCSNTS